MTQEKCPSEPTRIPAAGLVERAGHSPGSAAYRRAAVALFAAGMATFMTLYYVQGLLPVFTEHYGVSPAASALAVSATTALLAFSIVPAGMLSERFGRVRVMSISALSAAFLGLVLPWSPSFEFFLAGRALQGMLCAGVPAVAMAYLAEEIDAGSLGAAMGTYVAGTSIGGLTGRLIPTIAVDLTTWRWAMELTTIVALTFAVTFTRLIPPSKNFAQQTVKLAMTARQLKAHLQDGPLLCLFGLGFVLMGGFITVYNYLGYRLLDAPFNLPPTVVALVFLMYLAGAASSAIAGRISDSWGRGSVLISLLALMGAGLAISLADNLSAVLIGVLLLTIGFFGAHSISSSWVSARASRNRAGASSLYLLSYYLGSSVVGALGGIAFAYAGWNGLVIYVGAFLLIGAVLTAILVQTTRAR